MHLLNEIIDILSSSQPNVENALFKAQVLAHRLGEVDMKNWVVSELKGYADRSDLPPYRILPVTVMASLSNGVVRYGEQVLPLRSADARVRERLENKHLTESIAVIPLCQTRCRLLFQIKHAPIWYLKSGFVFFYFINIHPVSRGGFFGWSEAEPISQDLRFLDFGAKNVSTLLGTFSR